MPSAITSLYLNSAQRYPVGNGGIEQPCKRIRELYALSFSSFSRITKTKPVLPFRFQTCSVLLASQVLPWKIHTLATFVLQTRQALQE